MDSLQLLSEIQQLAASIETTYLQIGRLLCQARDTSAFTDGGFASIEAFAESALKYKPAKTRFLLRAADVAIKWSVSDDQQRSIGPSKLLMLAPVLTAGNKDEWLDRAQHSTAHDLRNSVAASRGLPVDLRRPFTVLLDEDQLLTVEQAMALALRVADTGSRAIALISIAQEALSSWGHLVDTAEPDGGQNLEDSVASEFGLG